MLMDYLMSLLLELDFNVLYDSLQYYMKIISMVNSSVLDLLIATWYLAWFILMQIYKVVTNMYTEGQEYIFYIIFLLIVTIEG